MRPALLPRVLAFLALFAVWAKGTGRGWASPRGRPCRVVWPARSRAVRATAIGCFRRYPRCHSRFIGFAVMVIPSSGAAHARFVRPSG